MNQLPAARHGELREAVRAACAPFGPEYWRALDQQRAYPEEFVQSLTLGGWLSALIPCAYGGSGLSLAEGSVILEEINRSGGNSACCHGQLHGMGLLLRRGTETQKRRWLPRVATGELRLQTLAVTEAGSGCDVAGMSTTATRTASGSYLVRGGKVWASRVGHSDGMLLLARTTPREQGRRRSDGLSFFLVAVHEALGQGMQVRPMPNSANHECSELVFDGLELESDRLIGEEGQGFRDLMDTLTAEQALVAGACVGDAAWFVEQARQHACTRMTFGAPIGRNQAVQFPITQAWIDAEAASLLRFEACDRLDAGQPAEAQSGMAKYLAAKAAWAAAEACLQTLGAAGFAAGSDVERKARETRAAQVLPVPTNQLLAYLGQHVLGLPRSY